VIRNDAFTVGGRVVFRETCGEQCVGRAYGTILAIGTQRREYGDGTECGAVVAWDPVESPYTAFRRAARVSFVPFWNQRFSATPEPGRVRS
jgi:hypothetical protein